MLALPDECETRDWQSVMTQCDFAFLGPVLQVVLLVPVFNEAWQTGTSSDDPAQSDYCYVTMSSYGVQCRYLLRQPPSGLFFSAASPLARRPTVT